MAYILGSRRGLGAMCALAAVVCTTVAYGQIGSYLGDYSTFSTSASAGHTIGGRYTGDPGASIAPKPEAYSGGPLSISLMPGMNYRVPASPEGAASSGATTNLGTLPSSLKPMSMPSAVPSAKPLGDTFGSPLPQTSVPQYERPFSMARYNFFKPTVTLDSMTHLQYQDSSTLQRIQPKTSSLGMFKSEYAKVSDVSSISPTRTVRRSGAARRPGEDATGGQTLAAAGQSNKQAEIVKNLSEIKMAQLDQESSDCLKRGVEAAQGANFRGTRDQPGAISLFRRAQLLDDKHPEPVVGLLVSFMGTGDYSQAAALVGPLVRRWPEVMAREDLLGSYGSPEQMRSRLMVIRQSGSLNRDPDLELLVAFFRWFYESRQAAGSDALRLASVTGPESSASALVAAMQRAAAANGG